MQAKLINVSPTNALAERINEVIMVENDDLANKLIRVYRPNS